MPKTEPLPYHLKPDINKVSAIGVLPPLVGAVVADDGEEVGAGAGVGEAGDDVRGEREKPAVGSLGFEFSHCYYIIRVKSQE